MKNFSDRQLRWIIAVLCTLAAVRVFVFAAAFPFFNNVDEQAHVDLVVKYAHGKQPHRIEPFDLESGLYFTAYSTPEYFLKPEHYGGKYPPPMWSVSSEQLQRLISEEVPFWQSRSNYESGEPPLYYAIAGEWFNLGRICGLGGLTSLYWVRFMNVALAAVLVWIGYAAARIVFQNQQFAAIATATLLAIWPQSSFYSIQGDSLTPVTFGMAFVALAKLVQSERPNIPLTVWLGLSVAATCLVKTVNLPLLLVIALAVLFNAAQLARKGDIRRALLIFAVFAICVALPLGIWFGWNQQHFGDLTATKSKIETLGWKAKTFTDWWSHPIFTPKGAKDFWAEVIASFWRGEFIWHRDRMATWWNDAFYWVSSTIALAIATIGLVRHRKPEANRSALWLALFCFAALVGFLVLLSIRFDFDDCPYPSRTHPFFTSGRLLNAAAVPFFLLFSYAIEQVAAFTRRTWPRWLALAAVVIAVCAWQLSINAPVVSSQYNFFHRPKVQ